MTTRIAATIILVWAIAMVLIAFSGIPELIGFAYRMCILLVTVLPVTGVIVVIFLWRVYFADPDRPRSHTIWILCAGSTTIVGASFITLYLASRVLFEARDPMSPESFGILIATAICTMLLVVHLFGLHVWRSWTGRDGDGVPEEVDDD